ncbi:MAG: response regulator, partial [Rhodoluna sp.]
MTRILLVEDESSLSEPLSFLLGREGFEVEIAEDGQLALDIFANGNFDIILLDLMIPKVPGNEVCRQIRTTSN